MRDALAGLEAQGDQAEPDLADDLTDLGEGDVTPLAVDLVLDRDLVAVLLGGRAQRSAIVVDPVPPAGVVPASMVLLLLRLTAVSGGGV